MTNRPDPTGAESTPRTPGPPTDAAQEREEWKIRRVEGGYILRMGNGAIPEVLTADALLAELRDRLGAAPARDDAWLREYERLKQRLLYVAGKTARDEGYSEAEADDYFAAERALDAHVMGAGAAPAERERTLRRILAIAAEAYQEGDSSDHANACRDIADLASDALAAAPREQPERAIGDAERMWIADERVRRSVEAELRLSGGEGRLDANEWGTPEPLAPGGTRMKIADALAHEVYQDDIRSILEALGLSAAARPYSPHDAVWREILPAIRHMVAAPTGEPERLERWLSEHLEHELDVARGTADVHASIIVARLLRGQTREDG